MESEHPATISESVAVMIGYTGSRGVHQPFRVEDMNIPLPDIKPRKDISGPAAAKETRVNPTFGQIEGLMWSRVQAITRLKLK